MAQIGKIYLGGREGKNNSKEIFNSGIAFQLNSDSQIDILYSLDNGNWEVEMRKGQNSIVARCKQVLSDEEILKNGFEYCQKSLDILSLQNHIHMHTLQPVDEHTLVINYNGQYSLRRVGILEFCPQIGVNIIQKDKDGNVIPLQRQPQLSWEPAFRFYRLSQMSSDLYEAYRNLFLAFESTLNQICPKNNDESETKWFKRALNFISIKIDLLTIAPFGTKDPVAFLVGTQYENVRCSLFHSKNKIMLPHENLNPKVISEAYTILLRLWREINGVYFEISNSGSVMTYTGFKLIMDGLFKESFKLQFTDDITPPNSNDTLVSPKNHPLFSLSNLSYDNNSKPEKIILKGEITLEKLSKRMLIHRIAILTKNTLFSIDYIKDSLSTEGIDVFETCQSVHLINKKTPITMF